MSRPPSRQISRRPPARKKCGLASGKIAASRQPGRKINGAKPPQNIQLKAVLPRDDNEKLKINVQSLYDCSVKLHCCIKIGKSEMIILFRTLWTINFYDELYIVYTKSFAYRVLQNAG